MTDTEFSLRATTVAAVMLLAVALIVIFLSLFTGVLDDDPPCPEYGTVAAVVDGERACIAWEKYQDLQDPVD